MAADETRDLPIGGWAAVRYGSFVGHLGIPSLDFGYGGEGESGGVYHPVTTRSSITAVSSIPASSTIPCWPPRRARRHARGRRSAAAAAHFRFRGGSFGFSQGSEKTRRDNREAAEKQATLLKDHIFTLTADPTKPSGVPTELKSVPAFDFAPLDSAVARLTRVQRPMTML